MASPVLRHLQRQCRAARYNGDVVQPLCPDGQHRLRRLQQERHSRLRTGAHQHALERFGGDCQTNNDGDPVVIYDPSPTGGDLPVLRHRRERDDEAFLQCVAVSRRPIRRSYYRYSFPYTGFNDYRRWASGRTATTSPSTCSARRGRHSWVEGLRVRPGQDAGRAAATQQCFDTAPPTAASCRPISTANGCAHRRAELPLALGASANTLAFWKFHVNWTTPSSSTFTGPTTLNTAAYSEACAGGTCIPQSGTTQRLDSLADRLMFRLAYRNFATMRRWSSTIRSPRARRRAFAGTKFASRAARLPSSSRARTRRTRRTLDGLIAWTGRQHGARVQHVQLHAAPGDPVYRPPRRRRAGTDDAGRRQHHRRAGSQTGSSLARWGDYSMMAVDPVDDCTFWFTTEYIPANGAFNWKTGSAR